MADTTRIKSFSTAAKGSKITNITPPINLTLDSGQVFDIVSLQGIAEGNNFLVEFSLDNQTHPHGLLFNKTSRAHLSPDADHLFSHGDRAIILQYCREILSNYQDVREFQRLTELNNQGLLADITTLDKPSLE